jgi:hypothetical protein
VSQKNKKTKKICKILELSKKQINLKNFQKLNKNWGRNWKFYKCKWDKKRKVKIKKKTLNLLEKLKYKKLQKMHWPYKLLNNKLTMKKIPKKLYNKLINLLVTKEKINKMTSKNSISRKKTVKLLIWVLDTNKINCWSNWLRMRGRKKQELFCNVSDS